MKEIAYIDTETEHDGDADDETPSIYLVPDLELTFIQSLQRYEHLPCHSLRWFLEEQTDSQGQEGQVTTKNKEFISSKCHQPLQV